MLPFDVIIPATVPQRSEIPEGLMNYPVYNWCLGNTLSPRLHSVKWRLWHKFTPKCLCMHTRIQGVGYLNMLPSQSPTQKSPYWLCSKYSRDFTELNHSHNKWSIVKILITMYCLLPPAFNPLRNTKYTENFIVFSHNLSWKQGTTAVPTYLWLRYAVCEVTEATVTPGQNLKGKALFCLIRTCDRLSVYSSIVCVGTRQRWWTYY